MRLFPTRYMVSAIKHYERHAQTHCNIDFWFFGLVNLCSTIWSKIAQQQQDEFARNVLIGWLFLISQWKYSSPMCKQNKDTARPMFLFSTTGDKIRFFRLEMQGVALERLLNDSPWSHAIVPPSILPTPAVAAVEYRRI